MENNPPSSPPIPTHMRRNDQVAVAQRHGISVQEARELLQRVRRFQIEDEHPLNRDFLAEFIKDAGSPFIIKYLK